MAIIESAALSELELGEYCRRKGIIPEQINYRGKAFTTSSGQHIENMIETAHLGVKKHATRLA